jgi:hypothetical protein
MKSRAFVVLTLLLAAVTLTSFGYWVSAEEVQNKVSVEPAYEYMESQKVWSKRMRYVATELNSLAAEGWEPISISTVKDGGEKKAYIRSAKGLGFGITRIYLRG